MSKFDTFIQNFNLFENNIQQYKSEDISESDTRSKMIDFMFKDALGWDESNIRREPHCRVGYIDYILKLDNFQFVVEAKKKLLKFALPLRGRRHKLSSLYKDNNVVIDQIRGYLLERGLTHGVITNGEQYIISRFVNTDGNDWKNNDAIIFQSFEKIKENLTDLYNLISFEAISQNGRIIIHPYQEFSKCLIDVIPGYTGAS